jgi:hypothetical protein
LVTDDEELGAITAPMKRVRTKPPKPRKLLDPHPAVEGELGSCELCCREAEGYRHPDPLRPGVILWRCKRHRFPATVCDNPKAAPGGGVYR